MTRNKKTVCIAIVWGTLLAAHEARAQVTNGDFEAGKAGWKTLSPVTWKVTFPAAGGNPKGCGVIASPFSNSGGDVCMTQSFSCEASSVGGGQCQVSLDYTLARKDALPLTGRVQVEVNGKTLFTSPPVNTIPWNTISFTVPCGTKIDLALCLQVDPGNNGWQASFDNVKARCVVPASKSGGGPHLVRGGVKVGAAELAELMRTSPPVAFDDDEADEGENEIGDPPPVAGAGGDAGAGGGGSAGEGASGPGGGSLPTPDPTVSWKALGPVGGFPSDAQVAASHTHVVVTEPFYVGFYDKAGTDLGGMTVKDLFSPLGLDDGTITGIDRYVDLRVIFDSYRNRFWVGANGGNMKSKADPTKRRPIFAVAISITENPLDGWYEYWWEGVSHYNVPNDNVWQPGDAIDYPIVGIDAQSFHQTVSVSGLKGDAKYWRVVLVPADVLASGQPGPISGWQFWDLKNPDGSNAWAIQPAVHHGDSSGRAFYASRQGDNQVVVWSLTDPLKPTQQLERVAVTMPQAWSLPVDAPQLGSKNLIEMTNLRAWLLKAVYRVGHLYLVSNDARDWGGVGTVRSSIRFIRLPVDGFPIVPEPPLGGAVSRIFGESASGDPAGALMYYGWPAVEANRDGDAVIVYARSGFSIYPEVRYSAYFFPEPDISPSNVLKLGEAPADEAECSDGKVVGPGTTSPIRWGDLAGASVDPKDDTGIWIAQQFARAQPSCSTNYQIMVGKVFGKKYPDLKIASAQLVGALTAGKQVKITGNVGNGGDGEAGATRLAFYLVRSGKEDIPIGTVDFPAVQAGATVDFAATARVPDGFAGEATVKVVVDPDRLLDEYSSDNNAAPASLGAFQLPGDLTQDARLDLSDAVWLLGHLFIGTEGTASLPCGGGTASKPGPGDLTLADVNGDGRIDIGDAVGILSWLFIADSPPPSLGTRCLPVAGCPDNSARCLP